jgi:hypothetical protein
LTALTLKDWPESAATSPSFPAGYRGLRQTSRPKRTQNVSKKFEDVLKKSELSPAESNLGAPNWARRGYSLLDRSTISHLPAIGVATVL